jgi:hypothetical protein
MVACVSALIVVFLSAAMLASCSPATGEALKDIHGEGQLDDVFLINRALCLSCHNERSIIESTEKYGGQAGLNIHQPPESMADQYGDCATCHKVDILPVLTCNAEGCHEFRLPKGWSAP